MLHLVPKEKGEGRRNVPVYLRVAGGQFSLLFHFAWGLQIMPMHLWFAPSTALLWSVFYLSKKFLPIPQSEKDGNPYKS